MQEMQEMHEMQEIRKMHEMHLLRIMHFLHCILLFLMHLMRIMHVRQLSSQGKFAVYFKLSDVHETQENSPGQKCRRFRTEFVTLFCGVKILNRNAPTSYQNAFVP